MKEMYENATGGDGERAREIDAGLKDVYETLFMTSGTITTKAALNLLGFDVGDSRLPLVEASDDERAAVHSMLERHHHYVRQQLEDMPEVRDWIWT